MIEEHVWKYIGVYVSYLGSLCVHHLLCGQVTLVSYQQLVDIFICIPIDLVKPLLDVVEALLIGDVINNLQSTH